MRIVLTGPKASGKSTLGIEIAEQFDIDFIETDELLEELYFKEVGIKRNCREIFKEEGEKLFREWEKKAVHCLKDRDWCVISTGGGSLYDKKSRNILKNNSILVTLRAKDIDILWNRIKKNGLPPFLAGENGYEEYQSRVKKLYETVEPVSDIIFSIGEKIDKLTTKLVKKLSFVLMLKLGSDNILEEFLRTDLLENDNSKIYLAGAFTKKLLLLHGFEISVFYAKKLNEMALNTAIDGTMQLVIGKDETWLTSSNYFKLKHRLALVLFSFPSVSGVEFSDKKIVDNLVEGNISVKIIIKSVPLTFKDQQLYFNDGEANSSFKCNVSGGLNRVSFLSFIEAMVGLAVVSFIPKNN